MLKLELIQYTDGCLIKGLDNSMTVNGLKPEPSKDYNWLKIAGYPVAIIREISQKLETVKAVLINKDLASSKIPLELPATKNPNYGRDEEDWLIGDAYESIRSLYKFVYEYAPVKFEPVEFEVNILATIPHSINNIPLNYYDISGLSPYHTSFHSFLGDLCLLDKTLLPYRPCYLETKEVFNIIRAYVKQNIDTSVAKITSDYDFHFKVEKVITLTDKEAFQADVSGWKSKKPKYETRYRDTRNVVIFDIATENKWGPVVEGLKANSYEELRAMLDDLLKKTIDKINEPLHDCAHCKGRGVVWKE